MLHVLEILLLILRMLLLLNLEVCRVLWQNWLRAWLAVSALNLLPAIIGRILSLLLFIIGYSSLSLNFFEWLKVVRIE